MLAILWRSSRSRGPGLMASSYGDTATEALIDLARGLMADGVQAADERTAFATEGESDE